MVELAIKVLAVIAGIVGGVASYPYLDEYIPGLIAFIGAVAVGIIVGALAYYGLVWLLGNIKNQP